MTHAIERLFIALWPDASVRSALAEAQSCWTWPQRAALVRAENLHATLHFLGNVPRDRVDALTAAIDIACEPFELSLRGAALWRGGIAVLETETPLPLKALHASVGEALERLRIPVESRPYRPHVTLARHAQGAVPPATLPPLPWLVRGHVLVRSAGGSYTVMARYGG